MATASQTLLDQKFSRSPGKIGMLVFGIVLVIGVAYAGSSLLHDLSNIHNESVLPYRASGYSVAGRSRVRVRQRIPRHRQRRGHGHLHPLARASHCCCLVRLLEFPRRARLQRPGSLRHRLTAAGRIDPASRQQSRIRHGLRLIGSRHHLEPRHLVVRTSCLQFAHANRQRHRSRHRQPAHERQKRHQRRRLGTSRQHRQGSAALAHRRFRLRRPLIAPRQSSH